MEENKKKVQPHEELFDNSLNKVQEISNKKSAFYYVGIIFLNIFFLALFWILIRQKENVAEYSEVIPTINWRYLWFSLAIIVLILLLQIFPDYIAIFSKTKKRKFGVVTLANNRLNFFNLVTSFSSGGYYTHANCLHSGGVSKQASIDVTYMKKLLSRISQLVYTFLFVCIGTILYIKNINIWIFVAGILAFLINCIVVIFILFFGNRKEQSLSFIAKLCKLLYKLKLIKNVDLTYKVMANRLFVYSLNIKKHKKLNILYVVCNFISQFLRHFILFVIVQALNFGSGEIFLEILFKCAILDMIISSFPFPKGTAIFEILFLCLFSSVFFSGYLLWGMIIYRLFDYFIYIIIYLITLAIEKIFKINNLKAQKDVV